MKREELKELRTAYRKIYENEDHSMTAEIYLEPVHYQDTNGSWREMDDTLVEAEAQSSSGNRDLVNEKGSLKIRFHNKMKKQGTISMKKGDEQLSWTLENAAKVKGEKNGPSEVFYQSVYEGMDLHCRVSGGKIKEDIVVQDKENAPSSITYLYQMKKLTPEQRGNKVSFLNADGIEVFFVAAPLMVDAAGADCAEIAVKLEILEKDSCRIIFTPNVQWLSADERQYPVIIDPVTTTSLGVTEIYDAYVSLSYPTTNTGVQPNLYLRGGTDVRRAFLKFELPELRSSDMIVSAQLALVSYNTDNVKRTITAHRVLQDWESSTLTWNNKPAYKEEVEDMTAYTADAMKYVTLDLTRLVKEWHQNGANYGVMLKQEKELSGTTIFLSSDHAYSEDDIMRPRISIQYRNFSGIEDFWTYHTQNVGRAGTVLVNDYCGNLVMKHDVVSTGGSRMPAQISLIYNSTYRTFEWGYGRGFRLNYYQTIASEKIGDIQYYRYTDGDGTIHYFYYNEEKQKWMDESGLDLTLVRTTEEDGRILSDITDKEGNKLHFNAGYLEKIIDRNENTLLIEHDEDQKSRITKITDGAGRVITLSYFQNTDGTLGNLSEITDTAGRKKRFGYDSSGRLNSITDHDGRVMTYGYNTSWLLNNVQDQDHYRVLYSYYSTIPYRVKKIQEYGRAEASASWNAGNSLTLEYGHDSTKFTDKDNRKEIYRFNRCGNLICIQDEKGHAVSARYHTEGNHVNRLQNTTKLQSSVVQLLKDPIIQAGTIGWLKTVSTSGAENLTASVNTDRTHCVTGTRSLKAVNTLSTGYVGWLQTLEVKKGQTYTFSMYVKTVIEEVGSGGGARLRIRYQDNTGTWKSADSELLTVSTNGFIRLKRVFTMPADSASNTIRCCMLLYKTKGTMYGDMAQLEEGTTASRCNLVDQGDFRNGLTGFVKTGSDVDGIVTAESSIYKPARYLLVVNASSASVYASASSNASVLETLAKGAVLAARTYYIAKAVDGTTTNWYEVDTTSGNRGYILSGNVRVYLSGADSMASAVCAGDGVNLRKSASITSDIVLQGISLWTTMCVRSSATDANGDTWYSVSLQMNGSRYSGFMKGDYVLRLCMNDPYGTMAAADNLYATPSLSGTISGTAAKGETVYVRGILNQSSGTKWYAVQKGNAFAFLPSSNITFAVSPNVGKRNTTKVPANVSGLDANILRFNGEPGSDKKLTKTLDLTGVAGDTYMVNAWGCGTPLPFSSEDRKFGVEVTFVHTDGTTSVKQASFSPDINEWQFLSEVFVAEKAYKSIKVAYVYCKNANTVFMDGLSLYREEFGQSYSYDEDNNLISAVDNQKQRTEFEYNSSQDMTGVTDTKGNNFKYEYDNKHNVTQGTSAEGMIYKMMYDDYGNIIRSGPKEAADSNVGLWLKRTMDEALHTHVAQVKDTYGNTTDYTWDTQKDLVTSIKDGKGNELTYGYDSSDRLTSVSQQVRAYGASTPVTVTNTYGYDKDRLIRIGHNGFHYQFFHDAFGNTSGVSIAGKDVITYTYEEKNGKLTKAAYANGAQIRYVYDDLDRVTETHYQATSTAEEQLLQSYVYGKDGNLDQVTDHLSGKTYDLDYDFLDRLMRVRDESGNYYEYTYDSENLMTRMEHGTADGMAATSYTYDKDGRETGARIGTCIRTTEYDALGRVKSQTWSLNHEESEPEIVTSYMYPVVNVTHEGNLPSSMTTPAGTYGYTYDANGNITQIDFTETGSTAVKSERYQYDELNQLIREDSESQGKTFIYCYDAGGNLTSVKEYGYSTGAVSGTPVYTSTGIYQTQSTSTSGEVWKDQLVSWTDGATGSTSAMTYDSVGNMLSKGSRTFQWKLGRKLARVADEMLEASYDYDHTGNRVKKTVTEAGVRTTTLYRMAGDLLVSEKTGTETIWYEYDSSANLVSMCLNGARYFYIRNVQNDIVGLADADGDVVVRYQYNAWGKLLNITGSMAVAVGVKNPFRYRGYYYDTETGFYYVSSRYYDPEVGRFINADTTDVLDVQSDLHDKNLYAYCDNNPVMRKDLNGQVWITVGIMAVGGVIGGVIGAVSSAVTQNALTGTINWKSVAVAGGAGFVSGAVAASPLGLGWQMGIGAGIGAASYLADCGVNKKSVAVDELIVATAGGLASGYIGGPGANQHMALTRTIQTSIKTTTRMSTRKATTYAAKQIASTKAWRNNVLTVNAMGSSARFAAGTGFSNALAGAWTTVKGWFSKLFK